jgi:chromosome segregation ATPase
MSTTPRAVRTAGRLVLGPVWTRMSARIMAQVEERLEPLRREIVELRHHQHTELQRQLDDHWQRLDRLEGRINELQFQLDFAIDETRRLEPHIASLEERVTTLDERATEQLAPPADGELDQARSVLDEVRTEHARIRARLTAVAKYEERLGRLEQTLTPH